MVALQVLAAGPPKKRVLRATSLRKARAGPNGLVRLARDEVLPVFSRQDAALDARVGRLVRKSVAPVPHAQAQPAIEVGLRPATTLTRHSSSSCRGSS